MQFQNVSIKDINKKYANKRPSNIKIIDIVFFVYIFIILCYLAFCLIFVQAQVIGASMQPTYNMNLSQEEFAYSIDMDRTYYSSVENGKRNISLLNIQKIANGLKVSLEELFQNIEKEDV